MSCADASAVARWGDSVDEPFRAVTHEEVWERGRLVERRLSYGEAVASDSRIVASDAADQTLIGAADAAIEQLRKEATPYLSGAWRVRLIAEAHIGEEVSLVIAMRVGPLSIVTSPEIAATHYELVTAISATEPEGRISDYAGIPIVWRNGSAAVLFHEAAGHAAEHGQPALEWPRWLSVTDGQSDLLAGEPPPHIRRASFRDVPLRRMKRVVVQQSGAPFVLPERRLEIHLLDGGSYEPLDESVTIRVAAADLVDGGIARRLEPFEIIEPRRAVAQSLRGAAGTASAYPGVVCSREGQELVVGSVAPEILTVF